MTVILVHGGAGEACLERADPALALAQRRGLAAALRAGQAELLAGGPAVAAVAAAVRVLEDDPVFNAGRGAALNREGVAEHDAGIMDGRTGAFGGVSGLTAIRHPVEAARLVMERSGHVLMHGAGAQAFALAEGAEAADPAWFIAELASRNLADWRADPGMAMRGTVGAVALDRQGRLAAATSTGGLTGKRQGRCGDAPVPGAGTWADTEVAVSCTGDGEVFLTTQLAGRIALAAGSGSGLAQAAADALARARSRGGIGGCIVLAADGTWAMPFTTSDLRRGLAVGEEAPRVAVFGDESPAPC